MDNFFSNDVLGVKLNDRRFIDQSMSRSGRVLLSLSTSSSSSSSFALIFIRCDFSCFYFPERLREVDG